MRRIFRITAASLALAMALAVRLSSPASAALVPPLCDTTSSMTAAPTMLSTLLIGLENTMGSMTGPTYSGVGQEEATLTASINSYQQGISQVCSLQSNVGSSALSSSNIAALKNMSTQISTLSSASNTHLQDESTTADAVIANAPAVNKNIQACNTANSTPVHGATEATQVNGACTSLVAQQLQQASLQTAAQAKQKQAETAAAQQEALNGTQIQGALMNDMYGGSTKGFDF